MAPAYVTEMFPTATRGISPGLSYHVGAAVASIMPVLMGLMQDRGMAVANIMTITICYHSDSIGCVDLAGARNTRPQLQRTVVPLRLL